MFLLERPDKRERHHDLSLGGTTAAIAGLVNVCSVIAFFAFASNVTGHVAVFAEELSKGHPHQVVVLAAWLGLFIGGAFVANLSITGLDERDVRLARLIPLLLQIFAMIAVGYYGHHYYRETLTETEYLVGVLVFSMGLQNSTVATVSNGLVKTTHLTGLSTDLGMEFSMLLQRRYRNDELLRFKLKLHIVIFSGYVIGGVVGGVTFLKLGFQTFYVPAAVLAMLVVHDLVLARAVSNRRSSKAAPLAVHSLRFQQVRLTPPSTTKTS